MRMIWDWIRRSRVRFGTFLLLMAYMLGFLTATGFWAF